MKCVRANHLSVMLSVAGRTTVIQTMTPTYAPIVIMDLLCIVVNVFLVIQDAKLVSLGIKHTVRRVLRDIMLMMVNVYHVCRSVVTAWMLQITAHSAGLTPLSARAIAIVSPLMSEIQLP